MKKTLKSFILLVFLVLANTANAADISGFWSLISDGDVLTTLKIIKTPKGLSVVWLRPRDIEIGNGPSINLRGPIIKITSKSSQKNGSGFNVKFSSRHHGASPVTLSLRELGERRALLGIPSVLSESLILTRVNDFSSIPHNNGLKTYFPAVFRTTNAEMTRIFNEDQNSRKQDAKINWKLLNSEDENRIKQTSKLLNSKLLSSGIDFYHAAIIFQHGKGPSDYLKAHILSILAVSRGYKAATWLSAATLDRYLNSIDKAQVFGTQYFTSNKGDTTQEPYNQKLVSDAIRKEFGVLPIAEQRKEVFLYNQ